MRTLVIDLSLLILAIVILPLTLVTITVVTAHNDCDRSGGNFTVEGATIWCRY